MKKWFIILALCYGVYQLDQHSLLSPLYQYFSQPEEISSSSTTLQYTPPEHWPRQGALVYTHQGVPVYSNGEVVYKSCGKHFAKDGYYYGKKWQCVEFIKRYFYDKHQHAMPEVYGHAKQFFNPNIAHSQINSARNLIQYHNHNDTAPKPNDLIVWDGKYGHVAIIAEVHQDCIIIVQQNIKKAPVAQLPYSIDGKLHIVGNKVNKPLGWLRIP